jgi:hypothetical protein
MNRYRELSKPEQAIVDKLINALASEGKRRRVRILAGLQAWMTFVFSWNKEKV